MFTGIVTAVGTIEAISAPEPDLRRLRIRAPYEAAGIALGASIACGGPCLTVVAREALAGGGCWFEVDAARETLERTTLSHWTVGERINLERAMKIGDERAHIPRRVLLSPQFVQVLAVMRWEIIAVGFVDRVVLALGRHADVLVAQHIRSD